MLFTLDPQILKQNIINSRGNILNDLDIDDVREIFIERKVFESSMFEEIMKKYSESKDQMSTVLTEIEKSETYAMLR